MVAENKTKEELINEMNGLRLRIAKLEKMEGEHKQMMKILMESEERYRKLTNLLPDAIGIHIDGKVAYINPAGIKLLGATSPEEIIGKPAIDFVHPAYREEVRTRIRRVIENEETAPLFEEKFIRIDGQCIDVEGTAIPFIS
ncbi:MAG: PAS domain S-box protein [bacterium]|nr:PAS domain S-box protein [bacterium]